MSRRIEMRQVRRDGFLLAAERIEIRRTAIKSVKHCLFGKDKF